MKIMTAGKKDAKELPSWRITPITWCPAKRHSGSPYAGGLPHHCGGPISIKVQPLSMGDREDPARLVFTSKTGPAIATSLVDLGNRFRLIINNVDCKKTEKPMPKLPVATAFWTPQPDLATGAEAWILAAALTIPLSPMT